jgi:hypothetical protein
VRGLTGCLLFLMLCSCSLAIRQPLSVQWPSQVEYIKAVCELDMDWDKTRYSGSMTLTMTYPNLLRIEVYGPFGETLLFVDKDGERFRFRSGRDEIIDQGEFESRLGLKIATVMNDLALRPRTDDGNLRFSSDVREGGATMCWEGSRGKLCMRFLEIDFSPS